MRMADAAKKGFDHGEVDRNDLRRDFAVSLPVDPLGSGHIGGINQAKPGTADVVEPVGHIVDPVLALHLEVPAVRGGNRFRGHVAHLVSVHKYRHGAPLRWMPWGGEPAGARVPPPAEPRPFVHSTTRVGCRAMRWAML